MAKLLKMPRILRRKWIKALRSGEYVQGQGCLRQKRGKEQSYCCLGVLHDVAGGRWKKPTPNSSSYSIGKMRNTGTLPDELRRGLKGNQVDSLIMMNDTRELSFKRIATWIEKNV